MLFGDGSYSISHGLQAYVNFTTLHCCTKYTSNMAAVTVVDRMTSLSSHGQAETCRRLDCGKKLFDDK